MSLRFSPKLNSARYLTFSLKILPVQMKNKAYLLGCFTYLSLTLLAIPAAVTEAPWSGGTAPRAPCLGSLCTSPCFLRGQSPPL